MKLFKKDKGEGEGGGFDAAGSGAPTAPTITPTDVQEKKFRRSSRPSGGYVMREVDEFLDEITDALTALIAENERLRLASSGGAQPQRVASAPASDGTDRAAVDVFLQREKAFLQDLGGLVQAHAVELKSMVRSARSSSTPAEAAHTPSPTAGGPVAAAAAAPIEEAAPPAEAEPVPDAAPVVHEEPAEEPADRTTGVVAEEPIRLDEPEPARSGRSDEQDRSLRELFWGEE